MTWLDDYVAYTQKQESPVMFHMWVAMTVLASALGRKCYVNKGYYRLYPNLFTILVAGSARCRKSTAINLGVALLDGIETTRVVSGKITPERFIDEIAPSKDTNPPNILVHSGELSVFLTKQNYGEPLIHILTDLYDCPAKWTYKTKNSGETTLHDVFLCILAATTPEGVAKGIPPSALEEGFASRVLFVFQKDTERRNALPELSAEELALRVQLQAGLAERSKISGEFKLSEEAKVWYRAWYDNMQPPIDKRLEGMFGRKHDHLLRLAMVFAASEGVSQIDPGHLDGADKALQFLEGCAPNAFSELGGDERTQFLTRARTALERNKRIPHSTLLRMLYPCRSDVFKLIMETLIESGVAARDAENPHVYVWSGDFQKLKT